MFKQMLEKVNKVAGNLSMMNWFFLKLCLFSVGILVGSYFATFFMSYINIVWSVAVITTAYVFYIFYIKKA